MAEQSVTLAPGESKVVAFEVSPGEARVYHVEVSGLSGSFVAAVAPELVTFSLEVYNIPSYAAGSYQWYITYGGKSHGMVDPEAGVWTPISDPIVVADVPPSGGLRATLHAGPYQSWDFTVIRDFRDGEAYRFNLEAGIIEGPGIVLTDLVVEPDYFTLGQSVTISVTAINTGDTTEPRSITFKINDVVVKTEIVELGPGEQKILSVTETPAEPGEYQVRVDELTASFKVKEPYPYIAEPKIESIEWAFEEWTGEIYPAFTGTIFLPDPGVNPYYTIRGVLSGGLETAPPGGVGYISSGLWRFSGTAVMPWSPKHSCYTTATYYYIGCPAAGCNWRMRISWNDPARLQGYLTQHVGVACELGHQPHCAAIGLPGRTWTQEDPVVYTTNFPCLGTKVGLTLKVFLIGPGTVGIVRTWDVPTDLYIEVDRVSV